MSSVTNRPPQRDFSGLFAGISEEPTYISRAQSVTEYRVESLNLSISKISVLYPEVQFECSEITLSGPLAEGLIKIKLKDHSSVAEEQVILFGNTVAVATGIATEIVKGEESLYSIAPPPIPVSLPASFPLGEKILDYSAASGAEHLFAQHFPELQSKIVSEADLSGELSKVIAAFPLGGPAVRISDSGMFEISVNNGVLDIGEPWFFDCLSAVKSIADKYNALGTVELILSKAKIYNSVLALLKNQCPFSLCSETGSSFLNLRVYKPETLPEETSKALHRIIHSYTGGAYTVEGIGFSESEVLIPPANSDFESSKRVSGLTQEHPALPKYLLCDKMTRRRNSNYVFYEINMPVDQELLKEIVRPESLRGVPAVLTYKAPASKISFRRIQSALEALRDDFPGAAMEVKFTEESSFVLSHHTPLDQLSSRWFKVYAAIIKNIREVSSFPIELNHTFHGKDFYNLISRNSKNHAAWSFETKLEKNKIIVKCCSKKIFDHELLIREFKEKYGLECEISLIPRINGAVCTTLPPHQTFVDYDSAVKENEYLKRRLPPALGSSPWIGLEGNRHIVCMETSDVPYKIIDEVIKKLSRTRLPVSFEYSLDAAPATDRGVIKSLVTESMPPGIYLHDFRARGEAYSVRYYKSKTLSASTTCSTEEELNWQKEVASAVGAPLEFRKENCRDRFAKLLNEVPGQVARFLAYSVKPDETSRSPATVRRLFNEVIIGSHEWQGSELDLKGRINLSQLDCFSIDPRGARLMEDLVSVEPLPNGNCRVGIHILDSSEYVQYGTPLDDFARSQSQTIYLGNDSETIQRSMLPTSFHASYANFVLEEKRPALSTFFEVTPGGDIFPVDYNGEAFLRSIVKNSAAYSFNEADRALLYPSAGKYAELQSLKRMKEKFFSNTQALSLFSGDYNSESALISNVLIHMYNLRIANYLDSKNIAYPKRTEKSPDAEKQIQSKFNQFNIRWLDEKMAEPQYLLDKLNELKIAMESRGRASAFQRWYRGISADFEYSADRQAGFFQLGNCSYTRASGPFRSYLSMTTQRQLSLYLQGQQPLSRNNIADIIEESKTVSVNKRYYDLAYDMYSVARHDQPFSLISKPSQRGWRVTPITH